MGNKTKTSCLLAVAFLVGTLVGVPAGVKYEKTRVLSQIAREIWQGREITHEDLYFQHVREGRKGDPLWGLEAVEVSVRGIEEEDERRHGLSRSELQTNAELKLRQAGIKVTKNASQLLQVSVLAAQPIGATGPQYSWPGTFTSEIYLVEPVYLARDCSTLCWGTTWNSKLAVASVPEAQKKIGSAVDGQVDQFLNAHLAANATQHVTIPTNTLYLPEPNKPKDEQKQ